MLRHPVLGALVFGLQACSYTPKDVATPERISVKDAFLGVEEGIKEFQQKLREDKITLGMLPCKITVNFNISAKANDKGNVSLALDPKVVAIPGPSLAAGAENTSEGLRGNQVAVELVSLACLPKDSLGAANPKNIKVLNSELRALGGQPADSGGTLMDVSKPS